MKRRLLFGLMTAVGIVSALSVRAEDKLVVHLTNGTQTSYALTANTVLKITQNDGIKHLTLKNETDKTEIAIQLITQLTFEEDQTTLENVQKTTIDIFSDGQNLVLNSPIEMEQVSIVSIQGAEVLTLTQAGKQLLLDASAWTKGVYIVRVKTAEGQASGKVLLQ